MASSARWSVEEILQRVDYGVDRLPHPVELLTIEDCAKLAQLPKSTAMTAIPNTAGFRNLVMAEAIGRLGVSPGSRSWAALRKAIGTGSPSAALALVLEARTLELVDDPAFPLFLSGYDHLEQSSVACAVDTTAAALIDQFVPFLETVVAAVAGFTPHRSPRNDFIVLHLLLTEAYRRLLGIVGDDDETNALLDLHAAEALLLEFEHGNDGKERSSTPLCHLTSANESLEGPLGAVVAAGATLVLDHRVPMRTGLTLAEVLEATGLSSATFYRRFTSLTSFEAALLGATGRNLADGYPKAFFQQLVESVRSGTVTAADALTAMQELSADLSRRHIEHGRPGHQATPWLGTPVGKGLFGPAYRSAFAENGPAYVEFAGLSGLSLRGEMSGALVAGALNAHSVVSELLIRNSPQRSAATKVMDSRMPIILMRFFEF